MHSVLKKTVASLETALRYNPNNTELMTSLVEAYIRMGRLDTGTLELCDKVLDRAPDNELVLQAQAAAFVVDQVDQIEAALAGGKAPPPPEAIQSSIAILEDIMRASNASATVWFAMTRLCVLGGLLERANEGLARLKSFGFEQIGRLRRFLDWLARHPEGVELDWIALSETYKELGEAGMAVKALESAFDEGLNHEKIGPRLLEHYLSRYSSSDPGAVPEAVRPRFFQMLLDHGEPDVTADWLRKATMFGWEVNTHSKAYARQLIEDGELDTAFELLQRMTMDLEVRDMLNDIANRYEARDAFDEAVFVLKFINEHVLTEADVQRARESELACEMEISLAELSLKNGRSEDALSKFISALCLSDQPDSAVIERIDEILGSGVPIHAEILLRLAAYFRRLKDHPKTVHYLNRILDREPDHAEAMHELENLFAEILKVNPNNPELRLELGKLYHRMGRFDDALEEFRAVAAVPNLAEGANRAMALAYQRSGRYGEALSRFQNVRLTEGDLDPLYQLHLDMVHSGDDRSAMLALEMIVKMRADHRDAVQRLKELDDRSNRAGTTGGGGGGDAKMQELIGDLAVGRYRYVDKIGSGGMGVVHKVVDRKLKKVVAMKILRDGLAGSSKALDRFFREARIAASIHHRNIVEIYDYNISSVNGQSYICMELVDGPSLRDLVDERFDKSVTIELDYITETLHYVVQVFDALEATHEKRIIHRDIKPDNVMITAAGEVKITDFGIVHVEEATFTPTGAMLGTPRYMSPEQVTGAKIDGRSDIYSVGILLYEVLTGSPPFMTGDISYQQVNKRPVEPRVINSVIPQSVNDFIMRCLEKDSDARHPSAREAKGVLAQILGDLGGCKKYSALTHADTRAPAEALREPKQAKVETNSLPSDLADLDLPPSEEFSSTGDLLTHPFGADNDFDLPADFDLD